MTRHESGEAESYSGVKYLTVVLMCTWVEILSYFQPLHFRDKYCTYEPEAEQWHHTKNGKTDIKCKTGIFYFEIFPLK